MVKKMIMDVLIYVVMLIETYTDIRKRKIFIIPVVVLLISGILMNLIKYQKGVVFVVSGCIVGMVLLFVSFLLKQCIGYGDSVLFIGIGACYGLYKTVIILWVSLMLAGVIGGIYLFIKKQRFDSKLAFSPFIIITIVAINAISGVMKLGV